MNPELKDMDKPFGFNVKMGRPNDVLLNEGFNEFGVRENYDGDELESIDVIFDAMEPGVRKQVEITPEFLESIASKADEGLPVQYDHSRSQRDNVGSITHTKFEEKLKLMINIPNTGSSIRSDTISDFTHSTGPQITDGSIGLDPKSLEFDESDKDEALVKFVDGDLVEFSLTPFPGGYDDGGIVSRFNKEFFKKNVESDIQEESAESMLEVEESKLTYETN